jgi:bacillithiol system protein YtxJ
MNFPDMNWNQIDSVEAVETLIRRSFQTPCLIFKHSTRCEISSIAKYRLEQDWAFEKNHLEPYFLDLLAYRPVSAYIADTFQVHHESPQVLIIHQGECVYDAAHLDIQVNEIAEGLSSIPAS